MGGERKGNESNSLRWNKFDWRLTEVKWGFLKEVFEEEVINALTNDVGATININVI